MLIYCKSHLSFQMRKKLLQHWSDSMMLLLVIMWQEQYNSMASKSHRIHLGPFLILTGLLLTWPNDWSTLAGRLMTASAHGVQNIGVRISCGIGIFKPWQVDAPDERSFACLHESSNQDIDMDSLWFSLELWSPTQHYGEYHMRTKCNVYCKINGISAMHASSCY